MVLKISKKQFVARASAVGVAMVVAAAAIWTQLPKPAEATDRINKRYQFVDTNYPVPKHNVLWVATTGHDNNNGSQGAPLASIGKAVKKATNGTTIVVKSGVYREPHFFVDKKPNLTIQAAPHAEVWLKGSDVIDRSKWTKEGAVWKTTGNYHNFCQVCTVNADPRVEGMAAYPEQVFINDQPLRQVASKAEVKPGTFYVEDKTPTTLKAPHNNKHGFHVGKQDAITYYVGSDPTAGTTEISERARAFTAVSENFTWRGINVAQYAPVQEWGYNDPVFGGLSGTSAVSVNGARSRVQDSIFAQSSNVGFNLDKAQDTQVTGNLFVENGANGAGANRAHGSTYENNTFTNNNAANFVTLGTVCKAYCTVSDIKVTHVENFTFRNNIVDHSSAERAASKAENARAYRVPSFWCDEGCVNTNVVGNFFTNSQLAILYEVSGSGIVASNIIESSGRGIVLSGSSDIKVYNNTISRTFMPIDLYEDSRINGCNHFANGRCHIPERWSQQKHLKWDLSNIELYNNIISSRAWVPGDGSGPYWAYPVRATGARNQDGTVVSTNDMFRGFDYNAYYRSSRESEKHLYTWDLKDRPQSIDKVIASTREVSTDAQVRKSIIGRDSHSFDTFGSRQNNPYFVKEAVNNTDYKRSNYNLKAGSPAIGSGKPLPHDVAKVIDPSGTTVTANTAVNRGALVNVLMDATNGKVPKIAPAPEQPKPQPAQPPADRPDKPAKPSKPIGPSKHDSTPRPQQKPQPTPPQSSQKRLRPSDPASPAVPRPPQPQARHDGSSTSHPAQQRDPAAEQPKRAQPAPAAKPVQPAHPQSSPARPAQPQSTYWQNLWRLLHDWLVRVGIARSV